ncbi:unnamed protein product [Rotaria sordida]|uniref:Fucosyltransferase n=1 Tax=Rotaria sordida TaxID=392033 RepID=A0A818ZHZ1_9BILA|nr:unnamed protein product [Rotaria sordida]CAF0979942.1 unnamed protein product [Rotaria sordida]CAF1048848.1 unnamed protein product [Rotaria sordida]CAF3693856.1 unnamed protein product [Rotaria sordida]CAF3768987.1 unnamed protein product [Rotaria sordida]
MHLRISRLRFVLVRCCLLLIILLFLLEMKIFFKNDNISNKSLMEILFWKNLLKQDQLLTNEQRIEQIELIVKQRKKNELNWTNMFYDIYRRKIEKLNQRDMKNVYKYSIIENIQNISQITFEIFEETPVFQRPKFCSSTHIFHPQCPYKNCLWNCKKSPINYKNIRRANIFHHVDINLEEINEKQKYRSHNDIWILWIDEANRQIEYLNEYKFNWTLSFRQDSEISIATYGLLIPNDDNNNKNFYFNNKSDLILSSDFLYILTNHSILITDFTLENYILTNYRYRFKHALWFVSNCEPKQRLKYYEQLKTYFPINAYGSCINNGKNTCYKNDQCEIEQFRSAFFYLAFESQTCTDYITEKFWRALHYGMIPIVFGPRKQSYLDLGIPKSAFIHVEDFKSAKQLGKYLHKISNDYFLYRNYFQWINHYQIFYQTYDLEPIRMCELCMRLNIQNKNEHRFYTNIHQWHRNEC